MLRPSTLTKRSSIFTAMFMAHSFRASSVPGDTLPGQQLEAAHAVRNIGLPVGDCLRFAAGRGTNDDHAGAEACPGFVEEWTGADQDALGFELVDEGMMMPRELLLGRRRDRPRLDHLVVDHPALLALGLAHWLPPAEPKSQAACLSDPASARKGHWAG